MASGVKELIENALDARANSVDIKLTNSGLDEIQVSDNGVGIDEDNFALLCVKGATNKICSIDDLTTVTSFGFRGEALAALCALCEHVTIFTKTDATAVGTLLEFDKRGALVKKSVKPKNTGTTVTLKSLFATYPVRQKHMKAQKRKQFAELIHLLNAYALAVPPLKMTCTNHESGARKEVFNYTREKLLVDKMRQVLRPVPTYVDFKQSDVIPEVATEFGLELEKYAALGNRFEIRGVISSTGTGSSSSDKQFLFVNERPVDLPKLAKIINQVFRSYDNATNSVYPFFVLSIKLPRDFIDVNVTPDKRTVLITNENMLHAIVKSSLLKMFGQDSSALQRSRYDQSSSQMTIMFERSSQSSLSEERVDAEPSDEIEVIEKMRAADKPQKRAADHDVEEAPKKCRITDFFGVQDEPLVDTARDRVTAQGDDSDVQFEPDELDDIRIGMLLTSPPASASSSDISQTLSTAISVEAGDDIRATHTAVIARDNVSQSPQPTAQFPHLEGADGFVRASSLLPRGKRRASAEARASSPPSQSQRVRRASCDGCVNSSPDQRPSLPPRPSSSCSDRSHKSGLVNVSTILPPSGFAVETANHAPTSTTAQSVTVPARSKSDTPKKTRSPRQALSVKTVLLDDDDNEPITRRAVESNATLASISDEFKRLQLNEQSHNGRGGHFTAALDDEQAEDELKRELHKDCFKDMKIIGQFNRSFILTQLGDEIFVIDQHASDERFNFDKLLATEVLDSQTLMKPLPMVLPPIKESLLGEHLEVFERNGFRFQYVESNPCGQRYLLKTVPTSRNESYQFGGDDVEELLEMIHEAGVAPRGCRPSRIKDMLASRACRSSIMINDSLKNEQMRRLVDRMSETRYPWTCAHGRPTIRHLLNARTVFHS